jgi:benzoylformate decarboxylase
MDLDRPRIDFVGLARSLGVSAERVEKTGDVGPALGRALARGGPTLLDVAVDGAFKA